MTDTAEKPVKTVTSPADAAALWTWDLWEFKLAALLAVVCGVLGVGGGFSLFLLVKHQEDFWVFLVGLLVAALVARVTEFIRELIDKPEHTLAERIKLPSVAMSVVFVGMFELYIMALHELPHEFSHAGGEHTAGAADHTPASSHSADHSPVANETHNGNETHNDVEQSAAAAAEQAAANPEAASLESRDSPLILLVGSWLAIGVCLTVALSLQTGWLGSPKNTLEGYAWQCAECLKPSALIALVGAPGVIFALVVISALIRSLYLMTTDHAAWHSHVAASQQQFGGKSIISFPLWVIYAIDSSVGNAWWSGWATLGIFIAIVCLGVKLFEDSKNEAAGYWLFWSLATLALLLLAPFLTWDFLVLMPLMAAVAFVAPALLLGASVPLLREPSRISVLWTSVALAVAVILAVATVLRLSDGFGAWGWMAITAVCMLFLAAAAVWGNVQNYWPLVALCVALLAGGAAQLMQYTTFVGVLAQLRAFNGRSPALLRPRSETPLTLPKKFFQKDYLEDYLKDQQKLFEKPLFPPLPGDRLFDPSAPNSSFLPPSAIDQTLREMQENRSSRGILGGTKQPYPRLFWPPGELAPPNTAAPPMDAAPLEKAPLDKSGPEITPPPATKPAIPPPLFQPAIPNLTQEETRAAIERFFNRRRQSTPTWAGKPRDSLGFPSPPQPAPLKPFDLPPPPPLPLPPPPPPPKPTPYLIDEHPSAMDSERKIEESPLLPRSRAVNLLAEAENELVTARQTRLTDARIKVRSDFSSLAAALQEMQADWKQLELQHEKLDDLLKQLHKVNQDRREHLKNSNYRQLSGEKHLAIAAAPANEPTADAPHGPHSAEAGAWPKLWRELVDVSSVIDISEQTLTRQLSTLPVVEKAALKENMQSLTDARRRLVGCQVRLAKLYESATLRVVNQDLNKLLELCLAASLGFWVTVSVMASWTIVRHRFGPQYAHAHAHASSGH